MDNNFNDISFLFDFDGVIVDTEAFYDKYWNETGKKYLPHLTDFNKLVKGQTLVGILNQYFTQDLHQKFTDEIAEVDDIMPYDYIPGAYDFLKLSKSMGIKTALVTSSANKKMTIVYKKRPELLDYFQCFITANKITKSKPDPQCYLLAAQELNVKPENCFVFEDSFYGMQSGRSAGMKVIGLATTNTREAIKDYADKIIDNFVGVNIEDIKKE